MEYIYVGLTIGRLHVGYKDGKFRDIDLLNAARHPFYSYVQHRGWDLASLYAFTAQRDQRLAEDGIHY